MRKNNRSIEQFRVKSGPLASSASDGSNGMFFIPGPSGATLTVIASDGSDWVLPGQPWEHVSVSTPSRCPTWGEMDFVKKVFWDREETVIQLHVPSSLHVNAHQYCLHLWKPLGFAIPLPPRETLA